MKNIHCIIACRLFFLFFAVLIFQAQPGETVQPKIVYLISTPRSCSTVCLRMMEASNEFIVMNEPSIYPFVKSSEADNKLTKGWFENDSYESFEEMKNDILCKSSQSKVFVKEICFFIEDFLLNDDAFVSNPDVQFVFLIRNPHNSTISYYKKFQTIVPNFTHYIGCRSSYNIYQGIKDKVKNPIIILSAEDLCNQSLETAQKFFSSMSIPFNEKCLHWDDLGDNFTGIKEWNEVKIAEKLYHWHDHAIHSTGFEPITENHVGADGNPTFEEIIDVSDRAECLNIYLENYPYYQHLRSAQRIVQESININDYAK